MNFAARTADSTSAHRERTAAARAGALLLDLRLICLLLRRRRCGIEA